MAEYLGDGIYRVGKAERLWSCRKAVMDDAIDQVEPGIPPADARFGWFKGAIPTPSNEGGFYVVEFLDDQKIRVLAYVDMYGRALPLSRKIFSSRLLKALRATARSSCAEKMAAPLLALPSRKVAAGKTPNTRSAKPGTTSKATGSAFIIMT